MNTIKLTEAADFDSRYHDTCYINIDEVSSIQSCTVGERSRGSKIALKNGSIIKVWETVEQIYKLVKEGEKDEQ
jgi:hypothetical protein